MTKIFLKHNHLLIKIFLKHNQRKEINRHILYSANSLNIIEYVLHYYILVCHFRDELDADEAYFVFIVFWTEGTLCRIEVIGVA